MSCRAQQLDYARTVIDTLCSPTMHGRGYVDQGDKLAAQFIAEEFRKAGLKKYSPNYFQPFTTPVNSFPDQMMLSINGKLLKPGEDFLIEPGAPGIRGKYNVQVLTPDDLLDKNILRQKLSKARSGFVVVSAFDKSKYSAEQNKQINDAISFLKYSDENPVKGTIILTADKLTWSGSTEVLSKPSFIVKSLVVNEAATTVEVSVTNKFIRNHETQNVIGYLEGLKKDSLIVFTAHYDHLGRMGKDTMFPGANDNASGVSLLLNLMKHFSKKQPDYTTVFIAFAAEEIGLVGSSYFTSHPTFPLNKIKFLINFDLAGTGEDGVQVVNGKLYTTEFEKLTQLNDQGKLLKQVKVRGEACNSDHCLFHSKGVPCFYVYTLGGIQAYHDIYDRPETLPLTEYLDYLNLIIQFAESL